MNLLANFQSSGEIQRRIASRFQARRLEQNYTQGAIVKKILCVAGHAQAFQTGRRNLSQASGASGNVAQYWEFSKNY